MSTISELKFTDEIKKKIFDKCSDGGKMVIKDRNGNKHMAKLVDRPTDIISYTLDGQHAMKVRQCGEKEFKLVV